MNPEEFDEFDELDPEEVEYLKDQLTCYYGSAMASGFPSAMGDLVSLDTMTDDEIVELAESLGLY